MNFYDELSQHVPYSRLTIRKIVARLTLQERIKRKEAQSEAELTKFHDLLQPCLDNLRKDPIFLRVLAEANPATPAIGAAQTGSPGFAPSPSPAPHATIPMEAVETVSKRPGGLHHLLNHPDGEPTADEEQSNVTAVDSATPASGPQATQSTPATKVPGELHLPKKETAPMTTPVSKRFTWTESIRQILWRYVQIEIELNILRSELASLEGKTLVVKEGAARRTAYLRLLNLWPEGWMTTYDISREYGTRKRKMEKFTGLG
ncbi:hypothetical protein IWQ60_012319 [Tieghemiomyces parasiticus]|uniref:Ubinuclein middle domain-containing protein n=1 Tax=Tieghemiomyces parasiticus TaxID=78921 RepID=A0A9W7ZH20_9FUNG|nr:hypothetical protein IWQ60_012319 [Tieghemiomyces parasiticus]